MSTSAEAIIDILVSVVRAEQLAIFEVDGSGACLNLLAAVQIDGGSLKQIGFGEGILGRAAASGRLYVDRAGTFKRAALWDESLAACIPLKAGGRLIGVIAIFGTRIGKFDFTSTDIEIFDWLTRHAGAVLLAPPNEEEGSWTERRS